MGWVSPTGHNDPSSEWTAPANLYDDDVGTFSRTTDDTPANNWCPFIELTVASFSCNAIRFYATSIVIEIDVDVYYSSGWHDVYEGTYAQNEWVEKAIPSGAQDITKARIRFRHPSNTFNPVFKEFDFGEDIFFVVAPTVTTQAVSSIGTTTATGNGNITATGGENCDKRGIVYGTSSQGDPGNVAPGASGYDAFEEETDSFGTGAFTRSLTGLTPGETYYARAYAHNSAGYSYGAEVTFYTSKVVTSSDTGSGADVSIEITQAYISSDTGSGVDAKVSYPTATILGSEIASGVEASSFAFRDLFKSDVGAGADAYIAVGVVASDVGLGADVVAALLAMIVASDVASGVDAHVAVGLKSSDSGVGIEKFWKTPLYCIEVSWDGTGNYDGVYDDITADVMSFSWGRGRETELRRAEVCRLELNVKNPTGKYSPPLASGVLYGSLLPKKPIRVRAFFGQALYQYEGYLEEIKPHPHLDEQSAYITAIDGLDFLARADIQTFLYKDQLTGFLVGKILDAAGWPEAKRDIDAGQDTVPYGYWHDRKARRSLSDLEESELGLIIVSHEGKLCWEDREHRHKTPHNTSVFTFDNTMADILYALNPKLIFNEIVATVTPWELGAEAELWKLEEEPILVDGVTKTWWAQFGYFADSIVTPVATTDYQAWTGAGGTGTDKTADISIVTTKLAKTAKLEVTNNSGGSVYLYLLRVRGEAYDDRTKVTRKAEDAQSQTDYQKRTLSLDGKYLTDADKAQDFCDYALLKYKEPQADVEIRLARRWEGVDGKTDAILEQILTRQVSDRITVLNTRLGLNEEFYIEKVTHEIQQNRLHRCHWTLTPVGTEYYWVSPTSHDDLDTKWTDETKVYDGDITSYASGVIV